MCYEDQGSVCEQGQGSGCDQGSVYDDSGSVSGQYQGSVASSSVSSPRPLAPAGLLAFLVIILS